MRTMFKFLLIYCLVAPPALADDVAELKEQIKELTKTVKDLQSTVLQEQNEINDLKQTPAKAASSVQVEGAQEQIQTLKEKVDRVVEAQKKILPSEFNPSIGLVGETVSSFRNRGSDKTGSDRPGGFDINQRSIELNIAAAVDPFATGYAVLNASADPVTGDANLQVEEAALQSTSLPWNLTLKAGRFFGEFGRLAYIHDHELPFVNRPLVLDQYIGGESQTDGAQLSWLLPTEHYINLTAGVGDKFGDPQNDPGVFRGNRELNYFSRLSTYFDVTDDWQIETGLSGLVDPRTESRGGPFAQPDGSTLTEKERRLAGFDFSLRYVPLQDNQFRGFTWGNEILYSDNRYLDDPNGIANDNDEFLKNVGSIGAYSYLMYKLDRQWSVGFLYDFVQNNQNKNDHTYGYSPFVTYALSHWNQLRLQYTHTDHNSVSGLKGDDAIYLQWSWIIGAHSHGWQQR
jgi:hypothetical protein